MEPHQKLERFLPCSKRSCGTKGGVGFGRCPSLSSQFAAPVRSHPRVPMLPICSKPKFSWSGSEEDALIEAMHRINELLARTM